MNLGRLTAFILAAFAALAAPSAHAIRTPIDTDLSALSEPLVAVTDPAPADSWFIEAVYPVGQAADGDFIDIAVLVAPETHTRVYCYVKSPLGLQVSSAEAEAAFLLLFGKDATAMKLWRSFKGAGGVFRTRDVAGDLAVGAHRVVYDPDHLFGPFWAANWSIKDEFYIHVEEDVDTPIEAAMLLYQGLEDSLAHRTIADLFDEGFCVSDVREARLTAFRKANQQIHTLLKSAETAASIVNEPVDWVLAANELAEGNAYAAVAFLPLLSTATVKHGGKALLRTTKGGRVFVTLSRTLDDIPLHHLEDHHIFFKSLGGSDEAANILSIRGYLHRGKGIGLHQHLAREVGDYGTLRRLWRKARGRPAARQQFLRRMRQAYSTFFEGSEDYAAIMGLVDEGLRTAR